MGSPTTLRYSLLKERRGFGDKRFLTLGDGDAGMSSYNPMLIGLGVRFVVFGNNDTINVRYKLSRVVDGDITDAAERRFVEVANKQWAIEGALGGMKLGFPQDPQPNYGVPQCFRMELISSNIRREVSQVYYFWLASGPSGSIAELDERVESGMAPFACCLYKEPNWTPAAAEADPAGAVFSPGSVGASAVDCEPEGVFTATNRDPDEGVYVPGTYDPIYHQPNAPTPLEPWYDEPAIPAKTSDDEMFTNGFVPAWFHVIGDTGRWHAYMIQHLAPSVAAAVPGGTPNNIPIDYADGPSLIPGPANVGLPILDDFWRLDPQSPADYTVTIGQTVFCLMTPPSWIKGASEIVLVGGKDATWNGGALNGQNFAYAPPATFADLLVTPSFSPPRIFNWILGTWSTNPGAQGVAAVAAGPIPISFPIFPGLVPGDVMAVQVLIVSSGNILTGQPAVPFGYLIPDNTQASNVYKMDVV